LNILLAAIDAAPEGRIFALDQQLLIDIGIQLLNACVLVAALSFFLYKPVRKFMQNRAEGIKNQLSAASDKEAKADELKALYEKKLEELEKERAGVLESAHGLAFKKSRQLMIDARKEILEMKEQAASEIQAERERAKEEMRPHMIEIAQTLAEKFVSQCIDQDTQNALFDKTIAELGDMQWKS